MSTRVAVVDLGSNSTRLLIADVGPGREVTEIDRRSIVTRLGQGVDTAGELAPEAMQRVFDVLTEYRREIDRHEAGVAVGVLTSAVRDAANGAAFAEAVRDRFGIAAHTIPGETEARLTYLGATSAHPAEVPTAVIDIGGGSTEIIVGQDDHVRFHVSTQVGVVRHSERHLHHDPPGAGEVAALSDDVAAIFAREIPGGLGARAGIAVAGTATQAAAMLEANELERSALEQLLARLASAPLDERRKVAGLDAARAETIVAGVAVLLEAMQALHLGAVEASDHDILRGVAAEHTDFLRPEPPQF